ncbi:MAG: hypothetical protein ACTSRB_04695 [Candidatus Helarchaeota archaeon]
MVNKKSLIVLMCIMTIIWLAALAIIGFLFLYVAPLQNPPGQAGFVWDLITDFVKMFIPVTLVIVWLYFWHVLIRMFFWRTLKNNNEENQKEEEPDE